MRTLTVVFLIGLFPLLGMAQSAEDYFQKGESLYNEAMYEQAIPLFDLAALNKQKKYKEAMADYDRVLSLDPKNTEAYNNRGWCKKWLTDTDGACADWNTSKRLGSEEAKIILKNNHCK